jgi:ATP-dependent RNA helicase DDX21
MFRNDEIDVLVCTDVAARGLDIKNVKRVFQVGVTGTTSEMFVHRSGRTGRAGNTGTNIVLYTPQEWGKLQDIQRRTNLTFEYRAVPQPSMLLQKSLTGLEMSLKERMNDDVGSFLPKAEQWIETYTAPVLVSALMKMALHWDGPASSVRSSITAQPGYKTFLFNSSDRSEQLPFEYKRLGQVPPKGVVVDVPMKDVSGLSESYTPIDEVLPTHFNMGSGNNNSRNGGGFRKGGNYGGQQRYQQLERGNQQSRGQQLQGRSQSWGDRSGHGDQQSRAPWMKRGSSRSLSNDTPRQQYRSNSR